MLFQPCSTRPMSMAITISTCYTLLPYSIYLFNSFVSFTRFYILQLILDPSSPSSPSSPCSPSSTSIAPQASLFTRWGRVGETGASQMKGPWPVADAVVQFGRQFKAKTGVEFARRKSAGAKKGEWAVFLLGRDEWAQTTI